MNLYLPRRHRRKLLFPPGLLALAGLLWLGSVEIEPWREQLKPRYAIRMTMPIRPRIDAMSGPTILWMAPNPDSLLRRDMWREGTLTGNSKLDGRQQQKITEHLRAILSDTLHDGGLRVRLEQTSRYANLIFLFDLMMRQNVKKGYWLDITRSPTTFYVITKAHKPPDPSLTVLPNCCGLGDDVGHYTPPLHRLLHSGFVLMTR
ncbi:hypothetical protein ACFQT0_21525 [Hymenobacter humi]|uniref:Uncharacterized protein n=1 Tax=Hymenobacter humi TaxID=1411620 RepID=A0ABW2U822_9BACT